MTLNYNPLLEMKPEKDAMFDQAVELIRSTGKASASFFQRHLQVGYARAASLLDEIEKYGIIGPVNGAKAREILIPHATDDGDFVTPDPKPIPKLVDEEINPIKWVKTDFANNKSDNFEIEIGVDENKKIVKLDLEKYGNLMVVGSQFTSAVDFLNNILVTSMATYSPDELRVIVIDGMRNDLIVPTGNPHLLTSKIIDGDKVVPALKWTVSEIERRSKIENISKLSKVLIVINSMNLVSMFYPDEINDNLYRIMALGRKCGVFLILGTEYLKPRMAKELLANNAAKLDFMAGDQLQSPSEAILETMYEGKTKVTINKIESKKIFEGIYK